MKAEAIESLERMRAYYRRTTLPQPRHGFKQAAWIFFDFLDRAMPDWERGTTLPNEAELTPNSRLGDHLAVTRSLMGFLP